MRGSYARLIVLALVCLVVLSATLGASAERRARRKFGKGSSEAGNVHSDADAPPAELKVEVTHRPDNCLRKTAPGDTIDVHYIGSLPDGKPFDSSFSRDQPLTITLGHGQVIPGWEQGLLGMCVDEMRKLTIPPHLAYGDEGYPPVIPPRATLSFMVKLVSIA
ncbi:peptidylprolyl cis-trans isomerase, FKBP-type domain containing protein [Acanthamoeba castellanii str. Neff]|uniref:peptidylprolyl isomerase n=1 Tax=Acanthamoeba castellanii (strain ATCC 30010 / Neff) TaxID=1257118 RepID=L8HM22_ACACF|nr:peptidylprolyl cis-trans isomerase, FKBP-type domain containing protein [Acanthamoeba castellanii str. Neff]ELR25456.1 peptidylprolyl cis-trans isomerase, FKBP-type domain containing protein [Acanthamoeba castellanii str. Neff]